MRGMAGVFIFIAAVLGGVPSLADDMDGLRCGGALIQVGDSEFKVLQECGKPTLVDRGQWVYDMGSMEPKRVIWIQDGYVRGMQEIGD